MADPKDKTGAGEPVPKLPAIPRLTPAIPEPVLPSEPGALPPPGSSASPPSPPPVAPAVPAIPPVAPPGRSPAAARPGGRSPTGSMPAVPPVAPVTAPPGRSPTGSMPAVPQVPPVAPARARSPTGSMPAVPLVPPLAPPAKAAPRRELAETPPVAPAPPAESTGPAPAASELESLEHRYALLDQLDYFQVMALDVGASPADIKRAFHHESRTYHPDRFFQSPDLELRHRVQAVYKRVTEAYFVLRDDTRRKRYLADITGPDRLKKLRFDELAEAEAKAAVKKEVAEQIGTHPKGRQCFQLAQSDLEAGRLPSAERNIKLALTYEPANALYKKTLEEVQAKLYEEFKRSGKGFRIE